MIAIMKRFNAKNLINLKNVFIQSNVNSSTFRNPINGHKVLFTTSGVIAVSAIGLYYVMKASVKASNLELHAMSYPWSHNGFLRSFDHKSIRRGYEVYKQVCCACHSLKYVSYRELVGVSHTKEEMVMEASEIQVEDGPDDKGKMFMRAGKLFDRFPNPYPNEEAAKHANNGALPPDLSMIVMARHGNEDYIFSLLTGYREPPAGVTLESGSHFNPYFTAGMGSIGMAPPLSDGAIEYTDGTAATRSQLAKDVVTFLSWTAQPEHDVRKKLSIDALLILGPLLLIVWYWKRHVWSTLKTRKIIFYSKPKSKSI